MQELPEVGKTRLAEYNAIRPLIPHNMAQPARPQPILLFWLKAQKIPRKYAG